MTITFLFVRSNPGTLVGNNFYVFSPMDRRPPNQISIRTTINIDTRTYNKYVHDTRRVRVVPGVNEKKKSTSFFRVSDRGGILKPSKHKYSFQSASVRL